MEKETTTVTNWTEMEPILPDDEKYQNLFCILSFSNLSFKKIWLESIRHFCRLHFVLKKSDAFAWSSDLFD